MTTTGEKQKGQAKTARIPIKIVPSTPLKKPDWIRVRLGNSARFQEIKDILRAQKRWDEMAAIWDRARDHA